MNKKETITSTSLPEDEYISTEMVFDPSQDLFVSQSNFSEIEFPKSRTVKYIPELSSITFSVDYQKVENQMKLYESNVGENAE